MIDANEEDPHSSTPRWMMREREAMREIHERGGEGQRERGVSAMRQSKRA
jgi:hypothetical protein